MKNGHDYKASDRGTMEGLIENTKENALTHLVKDAFHFRSGYPKVRAFARALGWAIVWLDDYGQWATQSIKEETRGTNGPRFDSFGELLEWLFAQVPKE